MEAMDEGKEDHQMKKKALIAAVLAATSLSVSTALAAENQFADIPADHWAYDAVNMLAKDGIIAGYPDGEFKGDKLVNRYEMAEIVAKAADRYEQGSPADKAAMRKLEQEYATELKDMDMRLTAVEGDVANLKKGMKFYGDARLRYFTNKDMKSHEGDGGQGRKTTFEKRVRLGIYAEPAENLTVDGRLKYEDNSFNDDGWGNSNQNNNVWDNSYNNQNSFRLDKFSLNWNHANTKVSAGRTEISLGQGLIYWENQVDGLYVQHQFGNKVTAMLGYGDISAEGWQNGNVPAYFANVAVQASPATKITLAGLHTQRDYYTCQGSNYKNYKTDYKLNQISLGINTQLSNKWNLIAEGIRNNAGAYKDKSGLWARATYGKQIWSKANTWNVYAEYFALGGGAMDSKAWPHRLNIAGGDGLGGHGARGWGLGVGYMLAANTNFEVTYYALRPYDENAAGFDHYNSVAYAALSYSF
jgi:hypothetical protein